MSKRLLGVLAIATLLLCVAAPAFAVEGAAEGEEHEAPSLDEIRAKNENNPLADDVLPPAQVEPPSWTQWLYIPLTVVAVLMVVFLGFRYLQWQPRFAEERRRKTRR
jgi:hypothetical protein